jgi:signal transduction histidine kinase
MWKAEAPTRSNGRRVAFYQESHPPELQEVREALQDIVQNDDRASRIIQRLRGLYRRASQERAPLDLNKLIDETLLGRANQASEWRRIPRGSLLLLSFEVTAASPARSPLICRWRAGCERGMSGV